MQFHSCARCVYLAVFVRLSIGQTFCAGEFHTCWVRSDSKLKCWGDSQYGQVGMEQYGREFSRYPLSVGDNLPPVNLGACRRVESVSCLLSHTCALSDDHRIRCWGNGNNGRLGSEAVSHWGGASDEMGDLLPVVDLGKNVDAKIVSTGGEFTCAVIDFGSIKCWGSNNYGQLGLEDTTQRGSGVNEMGDFLPSIDLGVGKYAKSLSAGGTHACAILNDETVKCWGRGYYGPLGQEVTGLQIGTGANQMGDYLSPVKLGASASEVIALSCHVSISCVILRNESLQSLKCWGRGDRGVNVAGTGNDVGDTPNSMGDFLAPVDLGSSATVTSIAAGEFHACAITDGDLKCWGQGSKARLGQGHINDIFYAADLGDNLPPVALGSNANISGVVVGRAHTCALLGAEEMKCFGWNRWGQLGIGRANTALGTTYFGSIPIEMGDGLQNVNMGDLKEVDMLACTTTNTTLTTNTTISTSVASTNTTSSLNLTKSTSTSSTTAWANSTSTSNKTFMVDSTSTMTNTTSTSNKSLVIGTQPLTSTIANTSNTTLVVGTQSVASAMANTSNSTLVAGTTSITPTMANDRRSNISYNTTDVQTTRMSSNTTSITNRTSMMGASLVTWTMANTSTSYNGTGHQTALTSSNITTTSNNTLVLGAKLVSSNTTSTSNTTLVVGTSSAISTMANTSTMPPNTTSTSNKTLVAGTQHSTSTKANSSISYNATDDLTTLISSNTTSTSNNTLVVGTQLVASAMANTSNSTLVVGMSIATSTMANTSTFYNTSGDLITITSSNITSTSNKTLVVGIQIVTTSMVNASTSYNTTGDLSIITTSNTTSTSNRSLIRGTTFVTSTMTNTSTSYNATVDQTTPTSTNTTSTSNKTIVVGTQFRSSNTTSASNKTLVVGTTSVSPTMANTSTSYNASVDLTTIVSSNTTSTSNKTHLGAPSVALAEANTSTSYNTTGDHTTLTSSNTTSSSNNTLVVGTSIAVASMVNSSTSYNATIDQTTTLSSNTTSTSNTTLVVGTQIVASSMANTSTSYNTTGDLSTITTSNTTSTSNRSLIRGTTSVTLTMPNTSTSYNATIDQTTPTSTNTTSTSNKTVVVGTQLRSSNTTSTSNTTFVAGTKLMSSNTTSTSNTTFVAGTKLTSSNTTSTSNKTVVVGAQLRSSNTTSTSNRTGISTVTSTMVNTSTSYNISTIDDQTTSLSSNTTSTSNKTTTIRSHVVTTVENGNTSFNTSHNPVTLTTSNITSTSNQTLVVSSFVTSAITNTTTSTNLTDYLTTSMSWNTTSNHTFRVLAILATPRISNTSTSYNETGGMTTRILSNTSSTTNTSRVVGTRSVILPSNTTFGNATVDPSTTTTTSSNATSRSGTTTTISGLVNATTTTNTSTTTTFFFSCDYAPIPLLGRPHTNCIGLPTGATCLKFCPDGMKYSADSNLTCNLGSWQFRGACIHEDITTTSHVTDVVMLDFGTHGDLSLGSRVDSGSRLLEESESITLATFAWAKEHHHLIALALSANLNVTRSGLQLELLEQPESGMFRSPTSANSALFRTRVVCEVSPELKKSGKKLQHIADEALGSLIRASSGGGDSHFVQKLMSLLESLSEDVPLGLPGAFHTIESRAQYIENYTFTHTEWFSDSWGDCSSRCGEGDQIRRVVCTMGDGACWQTMPTTKESCEEYDQCDFDVLCPLGRGKTLGCGGQGLMLFSCIGSTLCIVFCTCLRALLVSSIHKDKDHKHIVVLDKKASYEIIRPGKLNKLASYMSLFSVGSMGSQLSSINDLIGAAATIDDDMLTHGSVRDGRVHVIWDVHESELKMKDNKGNWKQPSTQDNSLAADCHLHKDEYFLSDSDGEYLDLPGEGLPQRISCSPLKKNVDGEIAGEILPNDFFGFTASMPTDSSFVIDGTKSEYFSVSRRRWVPATITVEASLGEGVLFDYHAITGQGQTIENVPLDSFRLCLENRDPVEIYSTKSGGRWHPGFINGVQSRMATKIGYRVRLAETNQILVNVSPNRLRVRFPPGCPVFAYKGFDVGWVEAVVDSSAAPHGVGNEPCTMESIVSHDITHVVGNRGNWLVNESKRMANPSFVLASKQGVSNVDQSQPNKGKSSMELKRIPTKRDLQQEQPSRKKGRTDVTLSNLRALGSPEDMSFELWVLVPVVCDGSSTLEFFPSYLLRHRTRSHDASRLAFTI